VKILVINPNSDGAFTELIGEAARKAASPGTEILCESAPGAPTFIETSRDEALCAPGMMELVSRHGDADAFLIACTCDPNLDVLREMTDSPVVGAGESSMLFALPLGARFSVIQTTEGSVQSKRELVRKYGLQDRCSSVRPIREHGEEPLEERLLEAARIARDCDGAEVVTLGCAGLAGLDRRLEEALGMPVIDGITAGVRLAEALAAGGAFTSRRGKYKGSVK
jgi:allantoin racemase